MTPILGKAQATAAQMAAYLLKKNPQPKFSRSIDAVGFCQIFLTESAKEGVRGDIAFAQACWETADFKYGGDVAFSQNNFAGLGATGGVPGNSFSSIEIGVLAQAQHLKSYATKDNLNCPCVDPRRSNWFMNTKGGTSPNVETLSGTWAVPGYNTKVYSSLKAAESAKDTYGYHILNVLDCILAEKVGGDRMRVAIDAGHGSTTAGKRTPEGYREHWINVKTAYYCEQYLKALGYDTLRVGWNDTNATDDTDVALSTRQAQIKKWGADVSISCHANAYGDGKTYNNANGVETLIHNNASYAKDSNALAKEVQAQLVKGTKQFNRGVKRQALAMCNCTAMGTKASVLIEIGFMTNKAEADIMKTEAFCKEQGEDAARGIHIYLQGGNVVVPSTTQEVKKEEKKVSVRIPQFVPKRADAEDLKRVVNNLKSAMNLVFGLNLTLDGTIDATLLMHLGNVVLVKDNPFTDLNYALEQLFTWWGFSVVIDGIYGQDLYDMVGSFQKLAGIQITNTTTDAFWHKILGR